jgi:hypothetical protein
MFVLDSGPDLTMWYVCFRFWTCSDNVVTTLSDQVQNLKQTYHIVRSGPKYNKKHTTLSDQVQNLKQTYHIVRSGPKSKKKHTTFLDLI